MIQLILVGVMLLAAGGAWWSHDRSQQEIGKAKAEAEYQRQQKEAEAANALKALEGEKYALELLAKAEARSRKQAQQIATLQRQRQEDSDAQARIDPVYKAWGEQPVPDYVSNRLRQRTLVVATDANGRVMPTGIAVPTQPGVPSTPDAADESWARKLYRRLTGQAGS